MVIKNLIFYSVLLLTWCISPTHKLPLKPLCRATLFSHVLDSTIELWNKREQGMEEDQFERTLQELCLLSSFLIHHKKVVASGNIEYLLSIFDVLELTSSHKRVLHIINAIKRELITLL